MHARAGGQRRGPADHDRLAAGARARRLRVTATRATRSWSRTRPTSPRCRPSSSPTYARTPIPGDDEGPDPDALIEPAARDRRQGRLPDPDLPEPDRPHDRRRAPRRARRGRRHRRACGWSRTTRTARCGSTASPSTCWPPTPPRATARSSSRRSRRSSRPACGSATCARPPRCAGRSPSPSRRPTCTPRRSPSWPPSAGWPRTTWARTSPSLEAHYRPRRDALLAGLREHLPQRLAHEPAPRAACSSGSSCPRATTPRRSSPRALERGVAFVPGCYFYAGEPRRNTLRVSFATATPAELAEGAARLGAAIAG